MLKNHGIMICKYQNHCANKNIHPVLFSDMPMPQFSTEERHFMVSFYERYKHKPALYMRLKIEFPRRFPGTRVPQRSTFLNLLEKWNNEHTMHNLNKESHL